MEMAEKISKRCLRCYNEQYWFGENFLFEYINDNFVKGKKILEIGCAEAGLLKFYNLVFFLYMFFKFYALVFLY